MPHLAVSADQVIELAKQLDPNGRQELLEALAPAAPTEATTPPSDEEMDAFANLPAFGMWSDREEMADSVEWLRKERERWHQRWTPEG